MREAFGDLFELPGDLLCILTNLQRTRNGENVMGGGCAAQARLLFPGVARAIGAGIAEGARFQYLRGWRRQDFGTYVSLAAFPTKDHWANDASLPLIVESARALMMCVELHGFRDVLLPRPGCGLGNLHWADVQGALEPILDDRIIIVDFAPRTAQAAELKAA